MIIKTGKDAELSASVVDGKIAEVSVLNKGTQYFSLPKLVVEATGITTSGVIGNGAILKPVIKDGKLDKVVVINPGIGYTSGLLNVYSESRGRNALLGGRISKYVINNVEQNEDYYNLDS